MLILLDKVSSKMDAYLIVHKYFPVAQVPLSHPVQTKCKILCRLYYFIVLWFNALFSTYETIWDVRGDTEAHTDGTGCYCNTYVDRV